MYDFIQHLINGLAAGTIYALVALGYTMVYGVLKLINFAHGDVMMVGVYVGYAVAFLLGREHLGSLGAALLVFTVSLLACAAMGFVIERFAYRPLRDKPRLTALITAIGISFALSYGFQLDFAVSVGGHDVTVLPGAAARRFPAIIPPQEWLVLGDNDVIIWNWQVLSFGIALTLMVGLQFLVFKTRFGKAMRAVSQDADAARLMGISVDNTISFTFAIGSALAGAAGVLVGVYYNAINPLMGLLPGLKAFVAAVFGGIGLIPGALLGGYFIGASETLVAGYWSSLYTDAVVFAILILVLIFKPTGLFKGKVV